MEEYKYFRKVSFVDELPEIHEKITVTFTEKSEVG